MKVLTSFLESLQLANEKVTAFRVCQISNSHLAVISIVIRGLASFLSIIVDHRLCLVGEAADAAVVVAEAFVLRLPRTKRM